MLVHKIIVFLIVILQLVGLHRCKNSVVLIDVMAVVHCSTPSPST